FGLIERSFVDWVWREHNRFADTSRRSGGFDIAIDWPIGYRKSLGSDWDRLRAGDYRPVGIDRCHGIPIPVGLWNRRVVCDSGRPGIRERIVDVHWAPTDGSVFLVAIQVEALDRTRLLSDVTRVLSDQHVNILSATVTTSRDRVAFSRFTFEMGDPKHLGHVLRAVRAIDGVYDVYRMTS